MSGPPGLDSPGGHALITAALRHIPTVLPVQQAGLLAADLLKAKDAAKAIAERARWRADERRCVRDGKLPRCGWMADGVPESPRWTEREADRERSEEKRRKVREQLGRGDGGRGAGAVARRRAASGGSGRFTWRRSRVAGGRRT